MKSRLIFVVAILCMFLAFACKKKEETVNKQIAPLAGEQQQAAQDAQPGTPATGTVPSTGAAVVVGAVIGDSFTADVAISNSLLQYVPADSLMVFASTMPLSADNAMLRHLMQSYAKLFASIKTDDLAAMYDELGKEVDGIKLGEGVKFLLDEMMPLLKDYKPEALEKFGFDPKAPVDSIAYFNGTQIVTKQNGIKDAAVLSAWLNKVIEKFGLTSVDETIAEQPWKTFALKDVGVVGVNISGNILTLVVTLTENKEAAYSSALKPSDVPYSLDSLKTLAGKGSVYAAGYLDNVKLAQAILTADSFIYKIVSKLDSTFTAPTFSEPCVAEITALAARFPRLIERMYLRELSPENISVGSQTTLAINDAENLTKIQSLVRDVPNLGVSADTGLGSFTVGLDLIETITYMKTIGEKIEKAPYTCEHLETLNGLKSLQDATVGPGSAQMALTAVRAIVEELTLDVNKNPTDVKLRAGMLGSDLVPALKEIAQVSPALASLKYENNVKESISLADMVGINKNIDLVFNETGAFAATPEADVLSIAQSGVENSIDLVNVIIGVEVLKMLIGDELPPEQQGMLFFNRIYYGLGVNPEGAHLNVFVSL